MKKVFLFVSALMLSVSMNAVDFLVQTGAAGDAKWTSGAATVVDLTTEGTTLDAWLTAHNGKEVWLAAGTYTVAAPYKFNPNTKIYGGFAGTETSIDDRVVGTNLWDYTNETIISGNGTSVIITCGSATEARFDGITFTKGYISGNGGAGTIRDKVTIANCKFTENYATGQGGALLMNAGGTIINSYFGKNKAAMGGAINAGGTHPAATSLGINGCVFEENTANEGNKQGGALRSQATGLKVNNCYFINNEATTNGGAIYTQVDTEDANVITNCVIYGTKTKHGLYMRGASVYNCTFVDNVAGAAYMGNATISKLVNCVFWSSSDNSTPGQVSGAAAVTDASIIENCAGVKFAGNATQTNCITLEKGVNTGDAAGKNYPFFTDPEKHDYTIKAGSPMIGAAKVLDNVTTDILGVERSATAPTIGAYEYVKTTPTGVEAPLQLSPKGECIKYIRDGQVVIMRNGEMYNVQGMKL